MGRLKIMRKDLEDRRRYNLGDTKISLQVGLRLILSLGEKFPCNLASHRLYKVDSKDLEPQAKKLSYIQREATQHIDRQPLVTPYSYQYQSRIGRT